MRGEITYTSGRAFAIATKPLALFLANNYLPAATARGLAIAFLASSLMLVFTAADPHRRFYLQKFSPNGAVCGVTFYVYAAAFLLLCALGSVAVLALNIGFGATWGLALAGVLLYVSEKIADEILRLRLFERDFHAWGLASIARGCAQIALLLLAAAALGSRVPAWLAVLAFACGNLLAFVPALSSLGLSSLLRSPGRLARWPIRRGARFLVANWQVWLFTLASSAVTYLDRTVALLLDQAILPLFMLVVMCFTVLHMIVDFYFTSRHRRDFLEGRISVATAFGSRDLLRIVGSGVILATAAAAIVLLTSRNGSAFPLLYVVLIAAIQTLVVLATVPQQIVYWRGTLAAPLRIETIFWACMAVGGVVCWSLQLRTGGVLTLVAACVLMRLTLYLTRASRFRTVHAQ